MFRIFTVGTPTKARKKLKFSLNQISYSEVIDVADIATQLHLDYIVEQQFSVNFHFLKNDKIYKRAFFVVDSIDHGLSFHSIESVLSSNLC